MSRDHASAWRAASRLLASAFALAPSLAAAAQIDASGEDFSGDWGAFFTPIDTAGTTEAPQTPTSDADNRSLGTWGGYYPVAGPSQGGLFLGDDELPNFIPTTGSLFGVNNPGTVGDGFLFFGAYPAAGGPGENETGGYAYTAFPSNPLDLSGTGRVQFDVLNGTVQTSDSVHLRLLLRLGTSSPQWVLSERFPITGAEQAVLSSPPADGSLFSDDAIIDVRPSLLSWTLVTGPADATLVPVAPGGEEPLVLGGSALAPDLSQVTGFGIEIDDDIARGDAYGVGVDAIRLLENSSGVECFGLYR